LCGTTSLIHADVLVTEMEINLLLRGVVDGDLTGPAGDLNRWAPWTGWNVFVRVEVERGELLGGKIAAAPLAVGGGIVSARTGFPVFASTEFFVYRFHRDFNASAAS